MQPIEAGHIRLEGGGTAQGSHLMGSQGLDFVAASLFKALWQHGDGSQTVLSTQGACAPGDHSCQNDSVRFLPD